MFKENSTEKLIEYIQSLPDQEQQLIASRISKIKSQDKAKKARVGKKAGLSLLKGKVTKMPSSKIDKQIKSLRGEWNRAI